MQSVISAILAGTVDYETGLDQLAVAPARDVDDALDTLVRAAVAKLADAGWQPAELHRVVARGGDPLQASLVGEALAAHARRFPDVDPRWSGQIIGGAVKADRIRRLDATLGLLSALRRLPPIEVLIPPPGTTAASPVSTADPRLLHRVRSLLSKAEATEFPAEAETYTAKAQELIARYSLEDAMASRTADVVPFARRIGVDHPYENEKASLLDATARANRCHTVWSPELGFSTVFGFDADLDAAELVYTSLLVQSHRAMTAAEPRGGKARIKAFRRSFLIAYAHRIGERLEAVTAAAAAAPEIGDLLPVLVSRDAQVRETMQRIFPHTVRSRGPRIDSAEGWDSGRDAADRATL